MEKKLLSLADVKFAASEDAGMTFSGYGAVFGNTDSHGDVIVPGAFTKSLSSGNAPLMFLNHDAFSLPIGKWTSLEEDDFGLKVSGELLDTTGGRDTYAAIKAGAITGLSIGFRPVEVAMGTKGTDEPYRTIKSVDLMEISVVTFPSNGKARVSDVKSLQSDDDHIGELIRLGMSRENADVFVSNIKSNAVNKYEQANVERVALELLSKLQGAK